MSIPHDWQTFVSTLGFISFWSTVFNLLAYVGLLIFTAGILYKPRQAQLFFCGGLMVWAFAVYGGNPIFVGAQTIMLLASFMRLRKVSDAAAITVFLTAIILTSMYFRGDIGSLLLWLGAIAAICLAVGVALAQRLPGNLLFTAGGILMGWFAYIVNSPPFLVLNVIFTIAVLYEIGKSLFSKKPV